MTAHKRQHVIPESYLKRFTRSQVKKDLLWVFDIDRGKSFQDIPRNVALKKNYYDVHVSNVDRVIIERDVFGKFEEKASRIIQKVCTDQLPLSEKDQALLIEFISLLTVRVPKIRNTLADFYNNVSHALMQSIVSSPETWERAQKEMKVQGIDVPEISYDDMKDSVSGNALRFEVDQNYTMGDLVHMHNVLNTFLQKRTWSFVRAKEGKYITCDQPVSLRWLVPPNDHIPPGFGLANTIVTCPIDPQIAVVGIFEDEPIVTLADSRLVAIQNGITVSNAERWIYSQDKEFNWVNHDNQMCGSPDLCS